MQALAFNLRALTAEGQNPAATLPSGIQISGYPTLRRRAITKTRRGQGSVMLPLLDGLVYGPVRSRRLGCSLGINVLPRNLKACTFNCSYCQYGWTKAPGRHPDEVADSWPTPSSIARAVAQRLPRLLAGKDAVACLTLAGHGEPTLHPRFAEVVAEVRTVRDALAPGLPVAVLSNSATLDLPGVVPALNALDARYMKLDAGESAVLRRVNAATIPIEQIVAGLSRLEDVVIQTMFVRDRLGRIDNATDLAVANWIGILHALSPKAVHVYSIDRAPAWPYLQAVPRTRLDEIVRRAQAAGLNATAFGGTERP
jgi:wyosine [tRNA(Phe)-imidazoG37] synthetase (radical SAM superfamily)